MLLAVTTGLVIGWLVAWLLLRKSRDALRAEVEQVRRSHRRLVADTSHELRNPLTVVRTNLDMLRRDLGGPLREEIWREAESEVERMARLVEELLLITTVEEPRRLKRDPVRLDVLAREMGGRIQRAYPDRVIDLSALDEVCVTGDRDKLAQILMNLVENAARYTPPEGEIKVRLWAESGQAVLEVDDNGIGIAPEHIPYLFDRFFRVDPARSRASGGTGLGLPIVQLLTRRHGGEVTVASTPGRGSTFRVSLPLAKT